MDFFSEGRRISKNRQALRLKSGTSLEHFVG
jgi:hypothetical protein